MKNLKFSYKSIRFQISASTWNDEFELAHGSYSLSDSWNYFECVIKKHETLTDNFPIQICVNKTEEQNL